MYDESGNLELDDARKKLMKIEEIQWVLIAIVLLVWFLGCAYSLFNLVATLAATRGNTAPLPF